MKRNDPSSDKKKRLKGENTKTISKGKKRKCGEEDNKKGQKSL